MQQQITKIVDLNLFTIKQSFQSSCKTSFTNEDEALKVLKEMENQGIILILPRVDQNKTISSDDLLNGKTGYPLVDGISNELRACLAPKQLFDVFRNVSEDNFNGIRYLLNEWEWQNSYKKPDLLLKKSLEKQMQLLCSLFILKESGLTAEIQYNCFEPLNELIYHLEIEVRRKQSIEYWVNLGSWFMKAS